MREVQFSGEVSAIEQNGQLGWAISFTLREVNSVAEKKDQRKKKPKAKAQGEKAPAAKSSNAQGGNQSAVEKGGKSEQSQTKQDDSFWGKIDKELGKIDG